MRTETPRAKSPRMPLALLLLAMVSAPCLAQLDRLPEAESRIAAGRDLADCDAILDAAGREAERLDDAASLHRVLVARGLLLLGRSEIDPAIEALTEAVRRDPASGRAREALAHAIFADARRAAGRPGGSLAAARFLDAAAGYRRAAGLGADPYPCHLWASEAFEAAGDRDAAIAEARAALAVRGGDAAAAALLVRLLIDAGRTAEALPEIRRLHEASPDDAGLAALLLRALLRSGAADEARRFFLDGIRRVRASGGGESEIYRALYAEAAAHFDPPARRPALRALLLEAIAGAPDDRYARYHLGALAAADGDFRSAESHFREYCRLREDVAQGHVLLAGALTRLGRFEEARRHIVRALEIDRSDPEAVAALHRLVAALSEGGLDAEALEASGWLLEVAGEPDPDLEWNHAILEKEGGRLEEALARHERILANHPGTGFAEASRLNDVALCLRGLGRLDEAEDRLRRALEEAPGHRDAAENLGVLLFDARRSAEALECFLRVLEKEPARERSLYYVHILRDRRPR